MDRHPLELRQGEYIAVELDQRGIDLTILLCSPEGERLAEVDTPSGDRGIERLSWIARSSGSYTIEVLSPENRAVPGEYEVSLRERRAAAPEDEKRVLAQSAYAEGYRLFTLGQVDSTRAASPHLLEARSLWHELRDVSGEAMALHTLGLVHNILNEPRKAITLYRDALALWGQADDPHGRVVSHFGMAMAQLALGNTTEAMKHYAEARLRAEEQADLNMEAQIQTNLGILYDSIGEREKALGEYQGALSLMRKMGSVSGEARTLRNIGILYDFLGEEQKALDSYRKALRLAEEIPGSERFQTFLISSIGGVYSDLGRTQEAMDHFQHCLTLARARSDRLTEGNILTLMASTQAEEGNHAQEVALLDEAIPLFQALEETQREAAAHTTLGKGHLEMGNLPQAIRALERGLALSLKARASRVEAAALTHLAEVHRQKGERGRALELLSRGLPAAQRVGDRPGMAAVHIGRAKVERDSGNFDAALEHAEAALGIVENLRGELSAHDLKTSFFGTVQKYHSFTIDLLMRRHERDPRGEYAALALHAAERARARGLLDLLVEARAEVREGVDPVLLEREKALQRRIAGKVERLSRLLREQSGSPEATAAAAEVETLRAEQQEAQDLIRSASPRYASLTQPQPRDLRAIQREVLDEGTVLLEYALGEERSFLWAVSKDSLAVHELPPARQVEAAARRVSALLTARNERPLDEEPQARERRIASADVALRRESAALSRVLLGPVSKRIGSHRLAIVPDGPLHYIPFSALPEPETAGEEAAPLGWGHEIVVLPSASVLAVQRSQPAHRGSPSKTLIVFADPVFDTGDERVAARSEGARLSRVGAAQRSADREGAETDQSFQIRESGQPETDALPRLPFTRREAEGLLSLVLPTKRQAALDFDASLEKARSRELADFRYVHFATHGILNSAHPELSGIVLSRVDRQGRKRDGFLPAFDIFNLKLRADLVALSACRSALGKEVRGEGLIGLTRAFLYAGASSVIASLWKVDDAATAELMRRFYERMLGPEGLPPAMALRQAQMDLAKQKRFRSPYYWSAFVLHGEWLSDPRSAAPRVALKR